MRIPEQLAIAIEHHRGGRRELAEQIYRQILQIDPDHADALHLLGVIAHETGNHEASVELILKAVRRNANSAVAYRNLAIAYHDLHRMPEAIASYRRALELDHNDPETHVNLGVALKNTENLNEAIACYRQALLLDPNCVEAHSNLGIEFKEQGQLSDAIACFRRALERNPDRAEIHNNLGNALKAAGQLDDAVDSYRHAITLMPDNAESYNNLGNVLKDQSRLDEAITSFRRAIELKPDFAVAHSNLVYTQLFHPGVDHRAQQDELRCWNERHASPFANLPPPHSNVRNPDRRLRIGYVSPDFRDHCQSLFTDPLFRCHDHEKFEIVCYSDVARPDQFTDRLRGYVDQWQEIVGLDDDQAASLIRRDQIDILVDLTMHMAGNRLQVFARKPAPIQVSWLAYPGTTGLPEIDYRLTDCYLDPPGQNDDRYVEHSIRLPDTFWCYDPLDNHTIVSALPALSNGFVTFGCLNNFCKVNTHVLKLWARVLLAVERSRLIILAGEGTHRHEALTLLSKEGIAKERVTFVTLKPRAQYLHYYDQIDIGLDTVPYNGHTTSLDSFWMGVPVVTLVGETIVGRAGLCHLMNLGMSDLIATTPDDYVRIATNLADDLPRLDKIRASLRNRLRQSPLMDAPRFTQNVEAAFREMWRQWCQPEKSVTSIDED